MSDESKSVFRVQVAEADAGDRLDVVLARHLPMFSRSRIQTLIKCGHVSSATGELVCRSESVRAGSVFTLEEPEPVPAEIQAEAIPLEILFEDRDVLVVNKPVGLVVHPGAGNHTGTLVNALLNHCGKLSAIGGVERPGIVHRIDKETSGCLVVAKTDAAHRKLAAQFADRKTIKIYLALAQGEPRWNEKRADFPIQRHPVHRQKMHALTPRDGPADRAREARTDFRVLRKMNGMSVIACRIHSGRTHQIRVHLQKLGHPIVGDTLYGGRVVPGIQRVMLHSWQLRFSHPRTGREVACVAPLPGDFLAAIAPLQPDPKIEM